MLVHVEVQAQPEVAFPKRMYVYNYRLHDRYDRCVVSLAVLADDSPHWRPASFEYKLWRCHAGLWFPTVKLLDYGDAEEALAASMNPFAVVTRAHLRTLTTRRDPEARAESKWALVRDLFERRFSRAHIRALFRFIDWLMALPPNLQEQFEVTVRQYEEERQMPYLSNMERKAIERGLQKGLEQGLEQGMQQGMQQQLLRFLRNRFQEVPDDLEARIRQFGAERLGELLDRAMASDSLESFRRQVTALPTAEGEPPQSH